MTMKTTNPGAGTDAWGFRIDSRNSFLMQALEKGGKSKEEIRQDFLRAFPDSIEKSTFNVFFTDVIRPFGSASVSRCVRIETDEYDRLHLDPERAQAVRTVVAQGILNEISALEGNFPKKDQQSLAAIVQKFHAPRR
jgi:CO/xanthine dehydrogenase Mo-binding subunit